MGCATIELVGDLNRPGESGDFLMRDSAHLTVANLSCKSLVISSDSRLASDRRKVRIDGRRLPHMESILLLRPVFPRLNGVLLGTAVEQVRTTARLRLQAREPEGSHSDDRGVHLRRHSDAPRE